MYIICGCRGEDYLKEIYCYDLGSNIWYILVDGFVWCVWYGMVIFFNKLYVIGGSNNDVGYRRDVYQVVCYSCMFGQWFFVCLFFVGYGEFGIVVLDNRIYVLGGCLYNCGSCMGYVYIYDVEKDCWEEGFQLDNFILGLVVCVFILFCFLFFELFCGIFDCSQVDLDFVFEVMSVFDWEEFDNFSEDQVFCVWCQREGWLGLQGSEIYVVQVIVFYFRVGFFVFVGYSLGVLFFFFILVFWLVCCRYFRVVQILVCGLYYSRKCF